MFGATVIGAAFIGPSFIMVLILSASYLRFGGLPLMRGAFYGIGASVIAIIGYSAWRLIRKTVGRDRMLWIIVAVNAVVTGWTQTEVVWVIAACGLIVLAVRELPPLRRTTTLSLVLPTSLLTAAHGEAPSRSLATIAGSFASAAAFRLGSALA